MAVMRDVRPENVFMGKLDYGCDLLEEITSICREKGIVLGRIEAIGAVKKARVGFYDQDKREYSFLDLDHPLEITGLTGNISLKNGEPIVHAHATFSDHEGRAFGGHVAMGTIVFACEFVIHSLNGPDFKRGLDSVTGLPLWEM